MRDANVTEFLRDDNHWDRPWRCGVLDEAGSEEYVQNRVHLFCGREVNTVGPRRSRSCSGNSHLAGGQGAGAKGDFKNTSENSARKSPNWVMTVGVQPRSRYSKAIWRMYDGKRFHTCRRLVRWSVLNRSNRAGEGERSAGGAEEAADSPYVGAVTSLRRWTKGYWHCGGEGCPRSWNKWRLNLGLRGDGRQSRDDVKNELERQTGKLPEVPVTAGEERRPARHLGLDPRR